MILKATFIAAVIKTIRSYNDAEWESFIREWMASLKTKFLEVKRLGGPGDMGRDVVGFRDTKKYEGDWVNCQCKHYSKPIPDNVALLDIAKIIYFSSQGEFTPPSRMDFFGPLGVSSALERLLGNPSKLKDSLRDRWETIASKKIVSGETIKLEGALKNFFESYNFATFGWLSIDEVLDNHRKSGYWAQRFGGLLPPAPSGTVPPQITTAESRYVRHLLDAYEERLGCVLGDSADLANHAAFEDDLYEQRQRFFDAESFEHTYRDQTEPGTVETFHSEIHDAVKPVTQKKHNDGVERLAEVLLQAAVTTPTGVLAQQAKVRVKQGVCHQLANKDRLSWRTKGKKK